MRVITEEADLSEAIDTILRATLLKIEPAELELLMGLQCASIAGLPPGTIDARECLDIQPRLLSGFWVLLCAVIVGYALYFYIDFVTTIGPIPSGSAPFSIENGCFLARPNTRPLLGAAEFTVSVYELRSTNDTE